MGGGFNRGMILLYWDIGRGIVEKQQKAGWGESVVERLAADPRRPPSSPLATTHPAMTEKTDSDHTAPEVRSPLRRSMFPPRAEVFSLSVKRWALFLSRGGRKARRGVFP